MPTCLFRWRGAVIRNNLGLRPRQRCLGKVTMMFRRLYWVTEEVSAKGDSGVSGIYTSIPDLIRSGIQSRNGRPSRLRLSLCKLDCADGPLGVWEGPEFSGIGDSLEDYVKTDDFSADQCQMLVDELTKVAHTKH